MAQLSRWSVWSRSSPMQWDDLDRLERLSHSTKRDRRIGAASDSDVRRVERDVMRAELGDMEDD